VIPYEPALITRLLRSMPDARLATVTPTAFQTWPVQYVTPGKLIRELIANEKARRNSHG
jgi:hypothetical protein